MALSRGKVFWHQYAALCYKHYLTSKRNMRSTLAQIFMGLAVCLLLLAFQGIANAVLSHKVPHPPTTVLSSPPLCSPGRSSQRINSDGSISSGCNTILFGPVSDQVEEIMRRVAVNSGLEYGVDILPFPGVSRGPGFDLTLVNTTASNSTHCVVAGCNVLPSLECMPCALVRDNATMTDWVLRYPNSTQNGVFFFGAYLNDTSHAITYNITMTQYPFFEDAHTAAVKLALDRALIELAGGQAWGGHGGKVSFALSVGARGFPQPEQRLMGYDVFSANGGQWCFTVPVLTFFAMLVDLVHEKEAGMRIGMRQMGLRTPAFWAAWLTYGLLMALASTLVLQAAGYAIGFTFFSNSNFGATFLMFMLFNLSMICFAVFLSTLLTSAKTAQTVGYSVVLIGFVLQFILTSAYAGLVDLLYSNDLAQWVRIVRFILERYPAFNFSKMFYDVSSLAGATINQQEGKLITGPGFFWSDMYQSRNRVFAGFQCTLPPPVQTLYLQLIDAVLFIVLAVYLDAVLPGPHGSPAHPLFFLGCRYRQSAASGEAQTEQPRKVVDQAVQQEAELAELVRWSPGSAALVPNSESDECIAVRLSHLRVVYRSGLSALLFALTGIDVSRWRGCCVRQHVQSRTNDTASGDVVAVHDVSLTVRENEILVLLGHNGAGKSTTISVLTGLLTASNGSAEVYGYDVNTQVDKVQKVMGVCPQHDILWPYLTAMETLWLFAAIKGLPRDQVEREVARVLQQVMLTSVAHKQVGGFSGGMKRRLSVAIAALGAPKVIYLDEPTTGMDPVNRLKCWRLIQRLKMSSSIILTTHNMDEANVLGDRVAIMAHGKIAALGTPLRLKNQFGEGYRINLVLRDSLPDTFQSVQVNMARLAPSGQLAAHDACNIAYTVPFSSIEAIPELLDWVEEHTSDASRSGVETASLITEYNVSGPTLESVFIKVSADAQFDLAQKAMAMDEDDITYEDAGDDIASSIGQRSSPITTGQLRSSYWALIVKNFTILQRQRGLFICQILTPLLVLGLLVLLQIIIKTEAGTVSTQLIPSLLLPLNMNQLYPVTQSIPVNPQPYGHHQLLSTPDRLAERMFAYSAFAAGSTSESLLPDPSSPLDSIKHVLPTSVWNVWSYLWSNDGVYFRQPGRQPGPEDAYPPYPPGYDTNCLLFFLYSVSPDGSDGHNASVLANMVGLQPRTAVPYPQPPNLPRPSATAAFSGLLGSVASNWCQLKNYTYVNAPFFDSRTTGSASSMDDELMFDANILNNASTTVLDNQPPCTRGHSPPSQEYEQWNCPSNILPDGTIDFHNMLLPSQDGANDAVSLSLGYTLQVNDLTITKYHRPNNFSRLGLPSIPRWASTQTVTVDPAKLALMDMMLRAYANMTGLSMVKGVLPSVVAVGTFPQLEVTNLMQFVEIVGAILHPIALTLQLPLFVFVTVLEKEERLVELQRAMGLKYGPYVIVSYLLNFFMYFMVCGTFWIVGHALHFTFFFETSQALLFFAFLGWGLALCSLAMLVTAFLWSRKTATVAGYVIALFGNLFAIIIAAGIYGYSLPYSLGEPLPDWLYVFPIFGLVRFLYLGTFNCIIKKQCYTDLAGAMAVGSEIRSCVVSMYIDAILYLTLALYLDQVLPRRYGVSKHPLFCLPRRIKRTLGFDEATIDHTSSDLFPYTQRWAKVNPEIAAEDYALGEDADVRRERQEVTSSTWGAARDTPHSTAGRQVASKYPVVLNHVRKEFAVPTPLLQRFSGWRRNRRTDATGDVREPLLAADGDKSDHVELSGGGVAIADKLYSNDMSGLYLEREQQLLASRGIKVAVSDFCLAIPAGTCFGLLGENGAGKSTLIAMLMGLYKPTAGDGLVNGHSITHQSDQVRLSIGICMQQDILWPTLTVEEHLLFYSRVKRVPAAELKAHVTTAMRRVGLEKFAGRYAKDLSGGMKRRLSLAIALVGDSKIVLADEVTTGLDPSSRRAVWRIIEKARKGRVIILVSHDMAEVEVLTNMLGIMTFGRMRCLGTQDHLKSAYGGGYILSINHAMNAAEAVKSFVTTQFPQAKVDSQFAGFLSFMLPAASRSGERLHISRVFDVMSRLSAGVGCTDWGVGQVSLDAIFQRLVRHYRGDGRLNDEDDEQPIVDDTVGKFAAMDIDVFHAGASKVAATALAIN